MDDPLRSTPDTDPAAQAFAELGRKVGLLEVAVTGLTAKRDAAPDYSETLGEMSALLDRMRTAINGFARSPAMKLAPEEMASQIAAAGTKARASDHAAIEQARVRFDNAAHRIEKLAGTVAMIRDQRRHLLQAAGGGLLAGILLWSFLPGVILRALPASWHMPENMAAHIIGEPSLWEAGGRMMAADNPQDWQAIVAAADLRRNNHVVISRCEQRATKFKRPVPCSIRVTADQR